MNISRLRPGSGFGLGLGAFLVSFLPLSLLPMRDRMPQPRRPRKGIFGAAAETLSANRLRGYSPCLAEAAFSGAAAWFRWSWFKIALNTMA